MPRILTDHDFDEAIIRGLTRRIPDPDWLPLRATAAIRSVDPDVLAMALEARRVVLTHDVKTLYPLALELVAKGVAVPPVIAVPRRIGRRMSIDELELLLLAGTPDDWGVGVVQLPLP
ncbi:MAG: hypothetical protein WED87_03590 [Dehalococcoidia bacterium]